MAGTVKPERNFIDNAMDSPIPTPMKEQWRNMRFVVMQATAFVVICCGAAVAWNQMARPLAFAGQVEVIQASVTSPETGVLTNVVISSFQMVKAGDPLAELICWGEHRPVSPASTPPRRIPLKAPIRGVVSAIHRQSGEEVIAGQNVITITAQDCKRIIGFIPANFPAIPEVGMKVEVRTRSRPKQKGLGQVVGVGPQWEPITNMAGFSLLSKSNPNQNIGRPVAVSLPPSLTVTPGEPVDLTLVK